GIPRAIGREGCSRHGPRVLALALGAQLRTVVGAGATATGASHRAMRSGRRLSGRMAFRTAAASFERAPERERMAKNMAYHHPALGGLARSIVPSRPAVGERASTIRANGVDRAVPVGRRAALGASVAPGADLVASAPLSATAAPAPLRRA